MQHHGEEARERLLAGEEEGGRGSASGAGAPAKARVMDTFDGVDQLPSKAGVGSSLNAGRREEGADGEEGDDEESGGGGGGSGGGGGGEAEGKAYKQSRLATIMSIVNTMMGTTIVALPFGLAESGIGSGLAIIALLGAISCYTCLILVESGPGAEDFSACVRVFLGRRVQLVAWGISVAIIVGAAIVYHILMQETLYALVATMLTSATGGFDPDTSGWQRYWAALIPWFLFPISNMPDLSALVRLNSLGFLFLAYVILFILVHGMRALAGGAPMAAVATLPTGAPPYDPTGILRVVVGGTPNFAALGGMMMLSFFIHNCIQPIVKNADPKTRRVDIIIA
jgi:sodium-coupled neutral amino acid transporter 9